MPPRSSNVPNQSSMKLSKTLARSPKSKVRHGFIRCAAVPFASLIVLFLLYHYSRIIPFPLDTATLNAETDLERILRAATKEDNTVIIATLNEAWALPGSIFDLFLESFRIGDATAPLLKHLVIVALDENAKHQCEHLHEHCFLLQFEGFNFSQEAVFMTPIYLDMMWRRISFLLRILELGFNFVFSDLDVMWLRNPFPQFDPESDFETACDRYNPRLLSSSIVNGGFNYVRSNNRSIQFYKYWLASHERFPGHHDQTVLNFIKNDEIVEGIGLKMRLLNTAYFGGFCEPSRNLNLVCTMHANCCVGIESKVNDLRVLLNDWKYYRSFPPSVRNSSVFYWRVPQKCNLNFLRQLNVAKEL